MMSSFDNWWSNLGSGITPKSNEDHEEHAKKVAALAWKAATENAATICDDVWSELGKYDGAAADLCGDKIRANTPSATTPVAE